ncbi:MAG: ABC transporter ATP-binding protein [Chloroflexota bacterium]
MPALIELKALTKQYRTGETVVEALCGIDLSIAEGEFVSIMGQSGSGKSTLMHVIGCLHRPTSGTYLLAGEDVSAKGDNALAEIRNRRIGFVFQSFNVLPRLTALENVELPLVYRGVAAAERRRVAERALTAVGLGHRLHHQPNQLSGGEVQRVAIARTIAADPPIILGDEPTGNLDSRSGREVMAILQDLHRQGRTIVLVTHDEDIARHSRRIIRLRDGRIISDQPVASPIDARSQAYAGGAAAGEEAMA